MAKNMDFQTVITFEGINIFQKFKMFSWFLGQVNKMRPKKPRNSNLVAVLNCAHLNQKTTNENQ